MKAKVMKACNLKMTAMVTSGYAFSFFIHSYHFQTIQKFNF